MKAMFIGVDIGGTHMRTALVDEGRIVRQGKVLTDALSGAEAVAKRLIGECRMHMDRAVELGARVEAIGLGVAGKINTRGGYVVFSPNLPALNGYPLAVELRDALNVPVIMENDANVFGIGEACFGAARGIENWIGIALGTGIGGCLFFGGRLWGGDDLGFAGEIGHMIIQPDGPSCACGRKGCLEAHSSGSALTAGVKAAASAGELAHGPLYEYLLAGTLDPEKVHQCARNGDFIARKLFDRMGWALGIAIANIFAALGVRTAIIGGGVSASWDQFISPLRTSLEKHSSMLSIDEMVVLHAELGDSAALLGAAHLAKGSRHSLSST